MRRPYRPNSADSSPVPEADLIELFLVPLHERGIDSYMVSGSVASIEYGEPRATLDVDIVLMMEPGVAPELPLAFPEPEFYCPPPDILISELARPTRGHFNIIHISTGLKADVYPSRNHPLFQWAFKNRREARISGHNIWLAPPEYVILWKLEFFREGAGDKHLRDVRGMLAVSAGEIDSHLVTEWADKLGLTDGWSQCYSPF